MNAYAVRSLEEIEMYHEDEINPAEYGYIYDVIVAESRSEARLEITSYYDCEYLEPLSIRLLCKGIDHKPGIIGQDSIDDIALHIQAACIWEGLSDIEEWEAWDFELTVNLPYHREALTEVSAA